MNKNMKRIMAVIAATMLLAVSLAACSGSGSSSGSTQESSTQERVSLTPITGEEFLEIAQSLGYAATSIEPEEDSDWIMDYFSYDLDDTDFIIDMEEYEDEDAAETAMKVWTDDDPGDNVNYEFERNDDRTAAVIKTEEDLSEFLWVGNTILCVTILNDEAYIEKANDFIDAIGGDYAEINLLK